LKSLIQESIFDFTFYIYRGKYPTEEYRGKIIYNSEKTSNNCAVYIDPLNYLTYDSTRSVSHYLKNGFETSRICQIIQSIFKIPENNTINYLLETEKKYFEILLSIYRSELEGIIPCTGALIVFDEYLDKDMTPIKTTFFKKLNELCAHPDIDIQVLIVTHSKSVCHYCDSVIVLQQGIFYRQGIPEKIMKNLPSEFVLLS
jgi:hypothetical protein